MAAQRVEHRSSTNDIYWTLSTFGSGGIYRTPIGSSTSTPLVTGQLFPFGVSLDLTGKRMYWGDSSANLVQSANLDGSDVQVIYSDAQTWKPLVDSVNGYVYFAGAGGIHRKSLDGSGPLQTVVTGVSSAFAIALDLANNHIYWVDQQTTADHIARANLDDTGWTVLVDLSPDLFGSSALNDIRLDLANGKMYFCDDLRTQIWRANLDGSEQEILFTGLPGPDFIALDLAAIPELPDYDASGLVDQGDLDLVLLNWRTRATRVPDSWTNVRPFGAVDQSELDAILLHWGEGIPMATASSAAAVPEPCGVTLVGMVALILFQVRFALLSKRSRHKIGNVRRSTRLGFRWATDREAHVNW